MSEGENLRCDSSTSPMSGVSSGLAKRDRPGDADRLGSLRRDDDDAARAHRHLLTARRDANRDLLDRAGLERELGRVGGEREVGSGAVRQEPERHRQRSGREVPERNQAGRAPLGSLGPAERKRCRLDGDLGRSGLGRIDDAAPLRRHGQRQAVAAQPAGAADERALQVGGREARPGLGNESCSARDHGGGGARPRDGGEALAAGISRRQPDAGGNQVGLHAAVEGHATRGEGRDVHEQGIRQGPGARELERGASRERGLTDLGGNRQHGDADPVLEVERPRRKIRPGDEHDGRTGLRRMTDTPLDGA